MYLQLEPELRTLVKQKLNELVGLPIERWPVGAASPLDSDPSIFAVRIDAGLRAVVQTEAGVLTEVLDLLQQGAIDWLGGKTTTAH